MPGFSLPGGVEPGLEATHYFSPSQSCYCNGTAVVELEVEGLEELLDLTLEGGAHEATAFRSTLPRSLRGRASTNTTSRGYL